MSTFKTTQTRKQTTDPIRDNPNKYLSIQYKSTHNNHNLAQALQTTQPTSIEMPI